MDAESCSGQILTLRPACAQDRDYIERVFFNTQRWLIETLFGWRGDDVEREKFKETYLPEHTSIILLNDEPIGWMTVIDEAEHTELEAIYIDTPMQRRGIGTRLIRRIVVDAARRNRPLRLSTAKVNPARKLYERLGFTVVDENRYKIFMELRP